MKTRAKEQVMNTALVTPSETVLPHPRLAHELELISLEGVPAERLLRDLVSEGMLLRPEARELAVALLSDVLVAHLSPGERVSHSLRNLCVATLDQGGLLRA